METFLFGCKFKSQPPPHLYLCEAFENISSIAIVNMNKPYSYLTSQSHSLLSMHMPVSVDLHKTLQLAAFFLLFIIRCTFSYFANKFMLKVGKAEAIKGIEESCKVGNILLYCIGSRSCSRIDLMKAFFLKKKLVFRKCL